MSKKQFLASTVEHVDISSFDARPIIRAMGAMSFSARETARAAEVLSAMVRDPECSIILDLVFCFLFDRGG